MTDVFIASNMPTSYPLKLQKPSTVSDRVRETADVYILDSGIGDDVSNREVLDHKTVLSDGYEHDGIQSAITTLRYIATDVDQSEEADHDV